MTETDFAAIQKRIWSVPFFKEGLCVTAIDVNHTASGSIETVTAIRNYRLSKTEPPLNPVDFSIWIHEAHADQVALIAELKRFREPAVFSKSNEDFVRALDELCIRYGKYLAHEDSQGAFRVGDDPTGSRFSENEAIFDVDLDQFINLEKKK